METQPETLKPEHLVGLGDPQVLELMLDNKYSLLTDTEEIDFDQFLSH